MCLQGEDILEYNESLSECRKLFTFVPTNDTASNGTATIKFWVEGKVKNTVTIHDVPVRSCSTGRSSSSSSFREDALQTSLRSNESSVFESSIEQTSIDEGTTLTGKKDNRRCT